MGPKPLIFKGQYLSIIEEKRELETKGKKSVFTFGFMPVEDSKVARFEILFPKEKCLSDEDPLPKVCKSARTLLCVL